MQANEMVIDERLPTEAAAPTGTGSAENEIMVVEQLPIITERFRMLSDQIKGRTEAALALACTEETYKAVKATRAELTKEFATLEDRRKEIKRAVMEPYDAFEGAYRRHVADQYRAADQALKTRIDGVEEGLKQHKRNEVVQYAREYAESIGVGFAASGLDGIIKITMAATIKALKAQAKAFFDRVAEDLAMIKTHEHADEIMVEYRRDYNAPRSITAVVDRRRAIAAQREELADREARQQALRDAAAKVEAIAPAPAVAPPVATSPETIIIDPIHVFEFKVHCTIPQAKALKQWLIEGGYDFE